MQVDVVTDRLSSADATIVIDVLRAFSASHVAFERGAVEILLAADEPNARALAASHPGSLLVGERNGLPIPGFDHGNSPTELAGADLRGRTLVHLTTNGVPATRRALAAGPVWVTGLLTARATATHLRTLGVARVQLVCSDPRGEDDRAVADYMRALLEDRPADLEATRRRIRASPNAAKFLDPARPEFPAADVDACLREGPGGFVMAVKRGMMAPSVTKVMT